MTDKRLEELLRQQFEKEAGAFVPQQAPKNGKTLWRRIGLAAACLLVASGFLAVPFLQEEDPHECTEVSREETSAQGIPPTDGPSESPVYNTELLLTSVTYKSKETASSMRSVRGGMYSLVNKKSVQNLSISLEEKTEITDCIGGRLLRILPTEGVHVDCDNVYYDIQADREYCLSCDIRERIKTDPHYVDICIRAVVEEHLITLNDIMAGVINYKFWYESINVPEVQELFVAGGVPTLEALGLESKQSWYTEEQFEALENFVYPKVTAVEYGTDENKCLFTLRSGISDNVWGVYLYTFDTGELKKLDGDTIGVPEPINGYMGDGYMGNDLSIRLSLASGVCVTENYGKIVVTVPYFTESWLEIHPETMLTVPLYRAENVVVFDVESGGCYGLLGGSTQYTDGQTYPMAPATVREGVVCFPTTENRWYLYDNDVGYTLNGELLQLYRIENGVAYAVMKQGDDYKVYQLDGSAEEVSADAGAFAMDGAYRVNLSTMEKTLLWEGEPLTQVFSADGRFAYLYFGGDEVLCVSCEAGETDTIAISETFLAQLRERPEAVVQLFLDGSEERLVITFYEEAEKTGLVTFDEEGYLSENDLEQFENYSQLNAFMKNLEMSSGYFCYGGEQVVIRRGEKEHAVVYAVGAEVMAEEFLNALSEKEEVRSTEEIMTEIMKRYASYLSVGEDGSVYVSQQVYKKTIGNIAKTDVLWHFEEQNFLHLDLILPR